MPIKSGIGFGEAQVYDISGLENNYYRLLQKQQQDAYKFQNELADLISKVKTEGARDIDKPIIAKGYEEIKNLYRQASSARSSAEKALIKSQIQSKINSLNEATARSAEEAKQYRETLNSVRTTGSYMFDQKKLDNFKNRINKPITELTPSNPLDLEKLPDDSSRDKAFDNMYTELKNKAQYGESKKLAGGKEQEIGVVDPKIVASNIMERLDKNPEWLNLATRNYIQANPGVQPEFKDIVANEVKLYMTRRGNEYISEPRLIHKETGKKESDEKLTYRQQLISGLINQDEDYRQELQANLPANSKVEYGVSKAVPGVSKGGYKFLKIRIPAESTENGLEVVETIPLQGGKPVQKLNYIINQYSPEKVSPSKVGIVGGKPRGERFNVESNQPKPTAVPTHTRAEFKKAGWTDEQLSQAVKKGLIKIK